MSTAAVAQRKSRYEERVERRKKRDAKVRAMFNNLYHVERLRIEDVEEQVADYWDLSVKTVRDIMRRRED